MKILLCTMLISACCGGMEHERRVSGSHHEMPPIIINVPGSKDPHRFIVYEERSDNDQIEKIQQQMERKIEPPKPETPSIDSTASIDSVSRSHYKKWLLISNGATALSTAVISAGVTVAIAYLNQKCPIPGTNTPTGTP